MERNKRVDVLRCLGTLLVITAHAGFPPLVQNIRTFDVVLLVYISGISAVASDSLKNGYIKYIKKRITKLIVPTYCIIICTFLSVNLFCAVIGRSSVYSIKGLIYSLFLMNKGIGYVWFIKIYIICAILLPYLLILPERLSSKTFFCTAIALLGIYFTIYTWYMNSSIQSSSSAYKMFIEEYLIAVFAYLIVYILGIKAGKDNYSNKVQVILFVILFVIVQVFVGGLSVRTRASILLDYTIFRMAWLFQQFYFV